MTLDNMQSFRQIEGMSTQVLQTAIHQVIICVRQIKKPSEIERLYEE